MQKILSIFFSIIIWSIFPSIIFSAENSLSFSADKITVKEGSISYAEGNVVLAYEQIFVNAHSLTYDQ